MEPLIPSGLPSVPEVGRQFMWLASLSLLLLALILLSFGTIKKRAISDWASWLEDGHV
jgi:hypothetical protein